MIGSNHLTSETLRQGITFPGQAHFAIPGDGRVCRDCWFWSPKRPEAKKGICLKAIAQVTGSRRGFPAVPRYATVCKHYTAEALAGCAIGVGATTG